MKNLSRILFFFAVSVSAQTSFKAIDLEGKWQSTKAGKELFIEINGATATIYSVEKTDLTPNIVGGALYDGILYEGNGTWAAQKNAWMYSGTETQKGHWEKANKLKLTLSADKNTLTASGHWSYSRLNKLIGTPTAKVDPLITKNTGQKPITKNEKQVVLEDFAGVKGKFTLITSMLNGEAVIAQFNNYTKDKTATVIVKLDNGSISQQRIGPGAAFTANYTAKSIEVQVLYYNADESEPFEIIDFVKGEIRKKITIRKGKIAGTGSMGVRG